MCHTPYACLVTRLAIDCFDLAYNVGCFEVKGFEYKCIIRCNSMKERQVMTIKIIQYEVTGQPSQMINLTSDKQLFSASSITG